MQRWKMGTISLSDISPIFLITGEDSMKHLYVLINFPDLQWSYHTYIPSSLYKVDTDFCVKIFVH